MLSFRTAVAALAAVSAFAAIAIARPQGAYSFPDAVEDILSGPIVEDFSCEGREYG